VLMKTDFDCECDNHLPIVNLNEDREEFCGALTFIEKAPRFSLYLCPTCQQYWRVDHEGLCNVAYAFKLESDKDWQAFDESDIIKANMLRSRGGFADRICKQANCNDHVINGSTYCLEHLYQSGARL